MWAALPLQPWLRLTTAKPPPLVRNLQNRQEVGGLGRVVVAALKSNEPNAVKPITKTEPPPPEERQLSGSDVLMALQGATAQKHNKKQKSRKNNGVNGGSSNGKALCIKPEWIDRLQQLERRLQELSHA